MSEAELVPLFRFAYDIRMLKAFILIIMLCIQMFLLVPTEARAAATTTATIVPRITDTAAIALYQTRVNQSSDDYKAWFGLGVAQAKQHHLQEAIAAFRRVITLQPALAEPHNNLAVIYDEQSKYQAAVNELETSLKLNPGYTTAYKNIGDLYVKLAANAYQKALRENDRKEIRQRYMRLLHVLDTPQTLPVDSGVLAALEAWRTAWSKRDTAAYFSAYAHDFEPGGRFGSFVAWKTYKRSVIGKRAFIHVKLEHIKAVRLSDGRFRVTFMQHFRSDVFNSNDRKELLFKLTPDGWKIVQETVQ